MKRQTLLALACCYGVAAASSGWAQQPNSAATPGPDQVESAAGSFAASDTVRRALHDELARAMSELRLPGMPEPYFISATVRDNRAVYVMASLGAIQNRIARRWRSLDVEVRIGDYAFDSSNFLGAGPGGWSEQLPFEDDYLVLRRAAWLAIDRHYKAATRAYEGKRAQRKSQTPDDSQPPSFASAVAHKSVNDDTYALASDATYEHLARGLSAPLSGYPHLQDSGVVILAATSRRTFVSTEGAEIVEPRGLVSVAVWAGTQAPDGMLLVDYATFTGRRHSDLPALAEMVTSVEAMAQRLAELRTAPVVDNYSGPVLFEGVAAGQVFEHLLANQLSGTPPPESSMGAMPDPNAFAGRVGFPVLPSGFSVIDDPGLDDFRGIPLLGGYRFDDEGVPGQRVEAIRDGKLRGLLMSRTPSKDFGQSNGHARAGYPRASGQASNLVVRARGVNRNALRARLRQEVKKEGLPYGLVVRRLDDPSITMLATVQERAAHPGIEGDLPGPIQLYQVLPDGRERLVRGASLHSLQTADLRDILAAGQNATVHHTGGLMAVAGMFGSGDQDLAGASIVAPDLLLRKVDVRKPTTPHQKPPVLSRPVNGDPAK
jgi:TldD protein